MPPAETASNTIRSLKESSKISKTQDYKWDIVWHNVIILAILHALTIYALLNVYKAYLLTVIFSIIYAITSGYGVTAGYHRLWAHRSYKAKLPLRIILMLMATAAGEGDVHYWVREHRTHHKFSETDADPHNAKRGFFFSHVGWIMVRKHPEVKRRGKEVDTSDVLQDAVAQFQTKYYIPLFLLICIILPTMVPTFVWGEFWFYSLLATIAHYVILLHVTWCVNSVAHLWGQRPYDKRINPAQNRFVSVITVGEGWHNYHHSFPWDYKTSELPYHLNLTTCFIELFAKIGWAYDFKTANQDLIKTVVQKHGDGSHYKWGKIAEIKNSEENFDMCYGK